MSELLGCLLVISIYHVGNSTGCAAKSDDQPNLDSKAVHDISSLSYHLPQSFPSPYSLLTMADTKIITYDQLKAHSKKDSIWLLVHEKGTSSSNTNEITRVIHIRPLQSTT
jgi:hypothetical protein